MYAWLGKYDGLLQHCSWYTDERLPHLESLGQQFGQWHRPDQLNARTLGHAHIYPESLGIFLVA